LAGLFLFAVVGLDLLLLLHDGLIGMQAGLGRVQKKSPLAARLAKGFG